jgi:hypothetical protein
VGEGKEKGAEALGVHLGARYKVRGLRYKVRRPFLPQDVTHVTATVSG